MKKNLSARQQQHLQALAAGERGAYPGLNMGTLASLERMGLARSRAGLGSMFSPRTTIKWRLTKEGQKLWDEMTGRI